MSILALRAGSPIAAVAALFASLLAPPAAEAQSDRPVGGFKVPPGWKVELFAAEPKLANPVAFCIDEKGRVFVAEEYRFNRGTEENRTRPFLLEDDLQLQTIDDRLAMLRKHADKFEGGMAWFSKYSDQVRLLEDRDNDGKAERSTVFADGFNGPLDGLAAGIIARDGDVYLTCIPNLWLLRDTDGDGKADVKKSLHRGFGVNAAFLGHDLHGLVWGPDGRLYFSVGDRGFHLRTKEGGTLHGPRTGAVFRCDPDGSNLEVVARGLRNPQELAFDPFGNLFAVDNNCDLGDHARLVYIMDGADSGWNMSYQTIPEPYLTGPWTAERMWHLPTEGQPAWIVPPVGKIGTGPSGFVMSPGIGLPSRYQDHFFYCNFTGNGGVESFTVKPKGAGFEMSAIEQIVTPVNATDVDFGYDGKMYLSDYGNLKWDGSNTDGRIYTVFDPVAIKQPAVVETQALMKEGFRQRTLEQLARLLAHPDMRVRQRAQFALAERGDRSIPIFADVLSSPISAMARLHAIWGLGQVGRTFPQALKPLITALNDPDPILRAQSVRALGISKAPEVAELLVTRLADSSPQVRAQAAMALGRIGHKGAVGPIFAMLRSDSSIDPFLRHAAVMGLLGVGDLDLLLGHSTDPSPAVRMAILLVLRRLGDARIARFLDDTEIEIVTEAARAINDVPIEAALPTLAKLASKVSFSVDRPNEPLARRIINANFRLGGLEQAKILADFAGDPKRPIRIREEALGALGDWTKPGPRDRVNGFWRPLPARDPAVIRPVAEALTRKLIAEPGTPLASKGIEVASQLDVTGLDDIFAAIVADTQRESKARIASLRTLSRHKSQGLREALRISLDGQDPSLRIEALQLLGELDPDEAGRRISKLLDAAGATVGEKQSALALLGRLKSTQAEPILGAALDRLRQGKIAPELQLDLIEAASARATPALRKSLDELTATRSSADPLAGFRMSLNGGDADRGRDIFANHRQAQCVRCHSIGGRGGSAGPDLSQVAARADRPTLLESMIEPDAKIAPGFGTVSLALNDGRNVTGVVKSEKDGVLVVQPPEGPPVTVSASQIEERSSSRSAMVKMGTILTPREIRDVIEYLSTLK